MLDRIYKAQKTMDSACQKLGRKINIMEVCGTHTVSIFRSGIRTTLPADIKLLSGPGCPVCVTDQGYIDTVISLTSNENLIVATYGDMLRVPGKNASLETVDSKAQIKIVLSTTDAVELAKNNPNKTVVFIAVGFETTAPATAVAVQMAAQQNLKNFCVLSSHKLVIPAMKALLAEKNHKIDAFLCPGHVSVIIGSDAYKPIVENFKRPCVVAGFEPMQIIEGIAEICRQLAENAPSISSVYNAAVTSTGNTTAQKILDKFFYPADGYWRGVGKIPQSTLELKPQYCQFDAAAKLNVKIAPAEDITGCRCGEVLCGLIEPPRCGMFGKRCTPDTPVGPCMVSSEGACSAWFKYSPKS